MATKPKVFVGSSKEARPVTGAIESLLSEDAIVLRWDQGVFGLSENYVDSLVEKLDDVDFAVLVMAPDDVAISRQTKKPMPRDNVLFELGLAIGKLGRDRCYFVVDTSKKIKLPSDLLGITGASYDPQSTGDLKDSLRDACTKIREKVAGKGPRPKLDRHTIAAYQHYRSFCDRLIGYWWQRVIPDDASALSFVRIEPHPATNAVKMTGDAYGQNGRPAARWKTVATCVNPSDREIFYLWSGDHPQEPDAPDYEGFGKITFGESGGNIDTGNGHFFDLNIQDLKSIRKKLVKLRRCTEKDVKDMQATGGEKIAALVGRKMKEIQF